MDKKELIQQFISGNRIAVAGVSRNSKKFGYAVYKELKTKGYEVVPVNPNISDIDGDKCYPSLNDIPGNLDFVVTTVPPDKTKTLVQELSRKDVKTIWMQKGSESAEAIEECTKAGINAISDECILMYAKPEGFHKFHRFIAKIFGKAAV